MIGFRMTVGSLAAVFASLVFATAAQATFPGKNGKIAFSGNYCCDSSGFYGAQIAIVNPPDLFGRVTDLTPANAFDAMPAWSPDGTKVAFGSDRAYGSTQYSDIYVMNADGTGLTRLTTDGASYDPAWSPDGKKIAFVSYRAGFPGGIYVMNADGTAQTMIESFNSPTGQYQSSVPKWSPDGRRIAFAVYDPPPDASGVGGIYVMNADGSDVTQLTHDPADENPDWSPNGMKIAFDSAGRGTGFIWVINADGTGLTQLTNNVNPAFRETYDDNPVWSPDGTKIAYASNRVLATSQPSQLHIWEMDANGTLQRQLTSGLGEADPSWQALPR